MRPRPALTGRRAVVGLLLFAASVVACAAAEARSTTRLADGWRFTRGSTAGAERPDFDDSEWQRVTVPHDWAITGPFDPDGDAETGKLPWRGEGWYRRDLELTAADRGRRVILVFDGVMAFPTVYLNGEVAGRWDYGYNSFHLDVTDLVHFGEANVLAVHGPLGAAFLPRAMERQLEIMREMGVNSIRTSHNVPAPEVLELCDRLGILVFAEAFDKWDETADFLPGGDLAEFAERQLGNFIRRDRNHPSIILWSVGNEIWDVLANEDGTALSRIHLMTHTVPRALRRRHRQAVLRQGDADPPHPGWPDGRDPRARDQPGLRAAEATLISRLVPQAAAPTPLPSPSPSHPDPLPLGERGPDRCGGRRLARI